MLTGGELAVDMLEVQCDATTRTYAAPIQLKANNGFLLIDDLGRQRVEPVVLFNRWIVPMDSRQDSLTTGKGHHFEVPFDLVLVFSTNLRPEDIADEAFLRRLGYKIEFVPITAASYTRIWRDVCTERGIDFDPSLVRYVIDVLHGRSQDSHCCPVIRAICSGWRWTALLTWARGSSTRPRCAGPGTAISCTGVSTNTRTLSPKAGICSVVEDPF